MGAQFLRTMGIPQLVARSASDYVRIACTLAEKPTASQQLPAEPRAKFSASEESFEATAQHRYALFYQSMRQLLAQRQHLVWEDMQVSCSQGCNHSICDRKVFSA
jgi:predicted O-linked N-acetylglucosamine transferase (SPINDLY family)